MSHSSSTGSEHNSSGLTNNHDFHPRIKEIADIYNNSSRSDQDTYLAMADILAEEGQNAENPFSHYDLLEDFLEFEEVSRPFNRYVLELLYEDLSDSYYIDFDPADSQTRHDCARGIKGKIGRLLHVLKDPNFVLEDTDDNLAAISAKIAELVLQIEKDANYGRALQNKKHQSLPGISPIGFSSTGWN